VELISKTKSLYDMLRCGNKYEYFGLWCVYCVPCSVRLSPILHGTQYTHHSPKYLLPQRSISYKDVILLINSTIL